MKNFMTRWHSPPTISLFFQANAGFLNVIMKDQILTSTIHPKHYFVDDITNESNELSRKFEKKDKLKFQ